MALQVPNGVPARTMIGNRQAARVVAEKNARSQGERAS
jgi:hypothetical protein